MLKNRIAVMLITAVLAMTVINQTCFAFPSILDDVPEKQILTTETSAGTFSDNNLKRAFKLLKYIGAISENEEDFMEDEAVSRAYAASVFGAIFAGATASGNAESFSDVPSSHVYAAGIAQALKCGILDTDTNKFYPNKNVSYEDIAQWALKALNYDIVFATSNLWQLQMS